MIDAYRSKHRSYAGGIEGFLRFTAATDTTTLRAPKSSTHQIYIQRIVVYITTSAAETITFRDSNNNVVAKIPASPGENTRWDFPFAPAGVPLDIGASFVMEVSDPGNAGHVEYLGYSRKT